MLDLAKALEALTPPTRNVSRAGQAGNSNFTVFYFYFCDGIPPMVTPGLDTPTGWIYFLRYKTMHNLVALSCQLAFIYICK